jgi:hypothetical protein
LELSAYQASVLRELISSLRGVTDTYSANFFVIIYELLPLTKMIDRLSAYDDPLGDVGGFFSIGIPAASVLIAVISGRTTFSKRGFSGSPCMPIIMCALKVVVFDTKVSGAPNCHGGGRRCSGIGCRV